MSQEVFPLEVDVESIEASSRQAQRQAVIRLLRYMAVKLVALFFTVAAGVYITVLIANMGGYVEDRKSVV